MSIETGGQAFPSMRQCSDRGEQWFETNEGMTLRDYFAAKALAGGIKNGPFNADRGEDETYHDWLARCAYKAADAMIAARQA